MEDLNLLSEELLEQIFVYLIDVNWEEDQIDEILDQIWGIEKELELKDNLILLPNFPYINEYLNDYKYLIIYESPKYILLQDIPNKLLRLSRTIRPIPIPRILNHLPRTRIQLQSPHKVQIPGPKNKRTTRTKTKPTNQEPNPIQPNK